MSPCYLPLIVNPERVCAYMHIIVVFFQLDRGNNELLSILESSGKNLICICFIDFTLSYLNIELQRLIKIQFSLQL